MKSIFAVFFGLILILSVYTSNSYALGGDTIWLKKTKRGIEISCPTGFEYSDSILWNSCKSSDSVFMVSLAYNDLFIEEEFFDEKEIRKHAIELAKIREDVKILDKKSSKWLGQIVAEVRFEEAYDKGVVRMVVFNDGTVFSMYAKTEDNTFETVDRLLSKQIKILDPNQVKEIERIQEEYTRKAEEIASKKAAEEYKKKIEQEQKAKEEKQKAKKKAVSPIGKNNVAKTITELSNKIQTWKDKVVQLDKRYEKVSSYDRFDAQVGFDYLNKSISEFENKINTINEKSTPNQINTMVKNVESKITSNYNFVKDQIEEMEHRAKNKNK